MTFVSAVLSNSFQSRIASLFSMNLSRLFHCSVIKVLCSLSLRNFYILSNSKCLSTTFLFFFVAVSSDSHIILSPASALSTTFFFLPEVFQDQLSHPMPSVVLTFLLSVPPHQRQLAYNSTAARQKSIHFGRICRSRSSCRFYRYCVNCANYLRNSHFRGLW